MKVAYPFPHLETEGSGRAVHVSQFLRWSARSGHEVLTLGPHPDAARALPVGRFARLRELRNCDCVYLRLEQVYRSPARWARSPYSRLIGQPPVIWEFNTAPPMIKAAGGSDADVAAAEETFRRLGRDVRLAICGTNEASAYAEETLGLRRAVAVANGSDPEMFSPTHAPDSRMEPYRDHLNVVWMGSSAVPWNDLPMLHRAAQMLALATDGRRITFHLLGEGAEPPGTAASNITTHGHQPYASLPAWLSAMDVGLCLYHPGPADFGSPLKLFDYLASGLAVISTPHPQVAAILDEAGQRDNVVAHHDAKALAQALTRLAEDRSRLDAHKERSRATLVAGYTWEHTVRRSYEAIAGVIE